MSRANNRAQLVPAGVMLIVLTNQLISVVFGHPSRILVSMALCAPLNNGTKTMTITTITRTLLIYFPFILIPVCCYEHQEFLERKGS